MIPPLALFLPSAGSVERARQQAPVAAYPVGLVGFGIGLSRNQGIDQIAPRHRTGWIERRAAETAGLSKSEVRPPDAVIGEQHVAAPLHDDPTVLEDVGQ